jgi:hypothetical protein
MSIKKFPVFLGGVSGAGSAWGVSGLKGGFWAALVFACAVALTGCFSDDKVAGGDDFPNSVEPLGKSSAEETSDTSSWNGHEEAPATPPESYDSTVVPDAPPEEDVGAGKRATSVETGGSLRIQPGFEIAGSLRTFVSLFDSLTGLTRAVRVQTTLAGIEARDTTWYRVQLLPFARRTVRMSGIVTYAGGRAERFSFEDADGDSVLSPQTGSRNLARARFVVSLEAGRTEERTVVLSAGPDRLFATRGDNVLRSVETVLRADGDTLVHLKLSPVPGDSVVRDPQRDSTRVDVVHRIASDSVRVEQTYRAQVHADSARNRALRFRRVVTTAAGTTETVALGRDSLPDFAAGDTGFVKVTFTSTLSSDTLASAKATYRVVLSDTAGRHAGNRLLAVEREKLYRFGSVSKRFYRLTPSAPVPFGSFARSGDLKVRLDFRAGGWIEYLGTSSGTGLTGTVNFTASGAITTVPAL